MYFNNVLMYIYVLLLNVLYHNFNKCYHVACWNDETGQ